MQIPIATFLWTVLKPSAPKGGGFLFQAVNYDESSLAKSNQAALYKEILYKDQRYINNDDVTSLTDIKNHNIPETLIGNNKDFFTELCQNSYFKDRINFDHIIHSLTNEAKTVLQTLFEKNFENVYVDSEERTVSSVPHYGCVNDLVVYADNATPIPNAPGFTINPLPISLQRLKPSTGKKTPNITWI